MSYIIKLLADLLIGVAVEKAVRIIAAVLKAWANQHTPKFA